MQKYCLLWAALLLQLSLYPQNWKLRLSSNVELRTWKLTDRAEKSEKALGGAAIRLMNGSSPVAEVTSKPNGDFTIDVPPNGDYTMEVSYAGCTTKRFAVSTRGVPGEVGNSGFSPAYSIGGFVLAKPLPGIDYSPLQQPLLKVYYIDGAKKFDNDEDITERGLKTVAKLAKAETELAEKFCALNKTGDEALSKGDCPLAKTNYEKAIALLPGEAYPATQLTKVADCLKQKENADKKVVNEAVAKAAAEKAAREQRENDKLMLAQAEASKKQAEKEKAADAQQTKKQAAAAPAANPAQTVAPAPTPTVKAGVKIKPKSEAQLEKEARDAKRREGMAKSAQEDRDAMAADREKAMENYKKRQAKEAERRQKEREGMAAAEAKEREEAKAESAKREEQRIKQREEEEKARQAELEERKKAAENRELQEGDYQIPQPLGTDQYKETIKVADELLRMKRYEEAKKKYEEALTFKLNDAYATGKLAEIAEKMRPK